MIIFDELENTNSINVEWAEQHRAIQNYQFGNRNLKMILLFPVTRK